MAPKVREVLISLMPCLSLHRWKFHGWRDMHRMHSMIIGLTSLIFNLTWTEPTGVKSLVGELKLLTTWWTHICLAYTASLVHGDFLKPVFIKKTSSHAQQSAPQSRLWQPMDTEKTRGCRLFHLQTEGEQGPSYKSSGLWTLQDRSQTPKSSGPFGWKWY